MSAEEYEKCEPEFLRKEVLRLLAELRELRAAVVTFIDSLPPNPNNPCEPTSVLTQIRLHLEAGRREEAKALVPNYREQVRASRRNMQTLQGMQTRVRDFSVLLEDARDVLGRKLLPLEDYERNLPTVVFHPPDTDDAEVFVTRLEAEVHKVLPDMQQRRAAEQRHQIRKEMLDTYLREG